MKTCIFGTTCIVISEKRLKFYKCVFRVITYDKIKKKEDKSIVFMIHFVSDTIDVLYVNIRKYVFPGLHYDTRSLLW